MNINELLAKRLLVLLQLDRAPVGVKLTYSKEEYNLFDAQELTGPLEYCVAVCSAGKGHSIKFTKENSGCKGSTCALGFQPPADTFYSGHQGCGLGLFKDPAVAAATCAKMKILKKPLYGIVVKPLDRFTEVDPDVTILVADAREIMRVIQGYTCTYGIQPELNATGNQAICVECTAYPMLTGRLNLSMLCSGTRFFAGWKSSEAAVGIPYSQLEGTVRGLRDTVNGTEMDDRKKEIIAGLKELGESTDDIAMQSAYYLITAREKAAKIKR